MPIGSSSGQYYQDQGDLLVDQYPSPMDSKEKADRKEIDANTTSGDFRSRFGGAEERPLVYITPPSTASTMPPGGSQELTGALESSGGTNVPGNTTGQDLPDIDTVLKGMEEAPKPTPNTLIHTSTGVDITDQDIDKGMGLAMSFSGGGLTFAGVRSAGIKGKLADLGHAQVLESNGVHPDEIWNKTGFARGADSRWRYEIDDSQAKFFPENLEKVRSVAYLSDVYSHPELFKAYPELKYIRVQKDPDLQGAFYQGGASPYISLGEKPTSSGRVATKDQGILAHEIQHAIQDIEGFSPGATYTGAQDSKAALYYTRSSGEVEARNVDTRLDLSPQRRGIIPPTWSEDMGRQYQLTTKGVGIGTEKGLEDSKTGALMRSDEPTQFRRAANDNAPLDPLEHTIKGTDFTLMRIQEALDAIEKSKKK